MTGDTTFPALAEGEIDRIFAEIQRDGFSEIEGVFTDELLHEARLQAEALIAENSGQYVARIGQSGFEGYLLNGLHGDPGFRRLCDRICSRVLTRHEEGIPLQQVFRCLQGPTGIARSRYLHFDSYVLTVLVPVAIPTRGPSGDLVLVDRRRGIRNYAHNVLEKVILDRRSMQALLWWLIGRDRVRTTRVRLQPGSMYLFLGYQTIHSNEPCDADKLRATVIFHLAHPHQLHPIRRLLGRIRAFGSSGEGRAASWRREE